MHSETCGDLRKVVLLPGRYNRQGRKAEERRSRDNHINKGNTRTQKSVLVLTENTGTSYNAGTYITQYRDLQPTSAPNASNN